MSRKFFKVSIPPGPPGPLVVTGLGFQPVSIGFLAVGYMISPVQTSKGGGTPASQVALTTYVQGGTSEGYQRPDTVIALYTALGADWLVAVLTSLDVDGFTLAITGDGQALTAFCEAHN